MNQKNFFGERFEELRKTKGMSQTDIASKFGKTKQAAYFWAKGSIPREPILSGLASLFDVSTDYLLGMTDDTRPKGEIKLTRSPSSEDKILYDVEVTGEPEISEYDMEIVRELMKQLPKMSEKEKKKMIPVIQSVILAIRDMDDD